MRLLVSPASAPLHVTLLSRSQALPGTRASAPNFGFCQVLLKVRQGDKFVFKALKKTVPALAHIEKFDLSSHADREELLDYTLQRNPRAVVLTHGDPEARDWFRKEIETIRPQGECKVVDPQPLKTVVV